MIRLAVSNADEPTWRDIAPRLLGAAIECCLDAARGEVPADCDAVAFVGTDRPEGALVERLLGEQRHVLLSCECLPAGAEVETLLAAGLKAGVQLAVANPDRFLPSRRLIRQQIAAGKLGAPGLVRVHRWGAHSSTMDRSPSSSGWPLPLLQDLDMACWLVGKLPNLVYAVERPAPDDASPAGRFVQVHLGFSGDGMALIDYTDRLPGGEGYQSLSVIGATGAAYADDHQNIQLLFQGGGPRAVRADEGPLTLATLVQEFVDALHAGRDLTSPVSGNDSNPEGLNWEAPRWPDVLALAGDVARSAQSQQAIPREGR